MVGQDYELPATVRFYIALDIAGQCLSTAEFRAAVVEHLGERINLAHVAISSGERLAGRRA